MVEQKSKPSDTRGTAAPKGEPPGSSASRSKLSSSSHSKRKFSSNEKSSTFRARVYSEPDVSSSSCVTHGKFNELVEVIGPLEAQVSTGSN